MFNQLFQRLSLFHFTCSRFAWTRALFRKSSSSLIHRSCPSRLIAYYRSFLLSEEIFFQDVHHIILTSLP